MNYQGLFRSSTGIDSGGSKSSAPDKGSGGDASMRGIETHLRQREAAAQQLLVLLIACLQSDAPTRLQEALDRARVELKLLEGRASGGKSFLRLGPKEAAATRTIKERMAGNEGLEMRVSIFMQRWLMVRPVVQRTAKEKSLEGSSRYAKAHYHYHSLCSYPLPTAPS